MRNSRLPSCHGSVDRSGKAPEDGSVTLVLKGTCGPRSEKYQSRISLSRYYDEDARRAFVDTGFAVVMRQIDPGFPSKAASNAVPFPGTLRQTGNTLATVDRVFSKPVCRGPRAVAAISPLNEHDGVRCARCTGMLV